MSNEQNESDSKAHPVDSLVMCDRIRMELFKEVYLQWCPEIKKYTGNIAEGMANKAVDAFDAKFNT